MTDGIKKHTIKIEINIMTTEKPILLTCYVDPDLDGTAGAIAYAEYLNKTGLNAVVGIIGNPHDEARFVLDRSGFTYPNSISNSDNFDKIILVDCSDLNGLEGKILPEKVIEIIDHRKIHEAHKFPNAKVQIELVGAAATLVAEKFMQNNVDISVESATLLLSAIISNTLNFKGTVTTDRDKKVAVWLNKVANLPENYWKELFIAKSDLSGDKLTERIVGDLAWFTFGNKKVGIAQIEMIGGRNLVSSRVKEIVDSLEEIKQERGFDYVFLNLIELENYFNILVASDNNTKNLLEKTLGVKFSTDWTEREQLIMRKQIVPLLKEELDNE